MADLSKITCQDGTTVDILSKTTRGIVRATMESTSTSTAFVITAPGITSLYDGATFICKNIKVNSASGCTMNVNGLGAKGMWCSQSNTAVTTHWTKNYTYIWVYDATNERWEFYQGRDTDNNDTYTVTNYYSHPVAGGNGLKTYSLFARLADGTYSSLFTNTGGTGAKTFDTETEFDLSKVFYANISEDIAAGSVMTNDNVWRMACINIDMRYNFTGVTTSASTSTLVANKPVYLTVENLDSTSRYFKLVSPFITQEPQDDSCLYVLLGFMRNSYYMDFHVHNPIYNCREVTVDNTTAYILDPWVEGYQNVATGYCAHAEGARSIASGNISHAEGRTCTASKLASHAEGYHTTADNLGAHSEGEYTIASSRAQHVSGKYNIEDTNGTYAEIIGNGTSNNARFNARTLDWDGNESILGNLKFMECDATTPVTNYPVNMIEPGIMWKERGYGDKFEIKPKFYGNNDENKLMVNASYGAAGTDPDVATVMHIDPLGDFGFGRDVYETWWNFNCTSSTNNVKIKITFPSVNWAKYHVEVIATANFAYIHSRVFVGTNDQNSINQCGYINETPTWTTVSGCSGVSNNTALTWTADKTNRIITSSAFARYGIAMIRITSSANPVYNKIKVEKIDG